MFANIQPVSGLAQTPGHIVSGQSALPTVAGVGTVQGPVAPNIISSVATAPGVITEQYQPVDQPQRLGPTQVLHVIHYDTPVAAQGVTTLQNQERLFNNSIRCSQEQLCSLRDTGRLSDGKTLAAHGLALQCNFSLTPALYELVIYFTYFVVEYQDAKKSIFFTDQMGAGGGVYGNDNNAGAFNLTNGNPNAGGFLTLSYPLLFSLYRSFALVFKWMSGIPGVATNPLDTFNAALDRKLIRLYLPGVEARDPHNG